MKKAQPVLPVLCTHMSQFPNPCWNILCNIRRQMNWSDKVKRISVRASEAYDGIIGQGRRPIKAGALLNNNCLVCNLKEDPFHPAASFIPWSQYRPQGKLSMSKGLCIWTSFCLWKSFGIWGLGNGTVFKLLAAKLWGSELRNWTQ